MFVWQVIVEMIGAHYFNNRDNPELNPEAKDQTQPVANIWSFTQCEKQSQVYDAFHPKSIEVSHERYRILVSASFYFSCVQHVPF